MQRQTLDFRTFFTLSTKPDSQEYSLAVDSKIETLNFKEKKIDLFVLGFYHFLFLGC